MPFRAEHSFRCAIEQVFHLVRVAQLQVVEVEIVILAYPLLVPQGWAVLQIIIMVEVVEEATMEGEEGAIR